MFHPNALKNRSELCTRWLLRITQETFFFKLRSYFFSKIYPSSYPYYGGSQIFKLSEAIAVQCSLRDPPKQI